MEFWGDSGRVIVVPVLADGRFSEMARCELQVDALSVAWEELDSTGIDDESFSATVRGQHEAVAHALLHAWGGSPTEGSRLRVQFVEAEEDVPFLVGVVPASVFFGAGEAA